MEGAFSQDKEIFEEDKENKCKDTFIKSYRHICYSKAR